MSTSWRDSTHRMTLDALLCAGAMMLSYLEYLLPVNAFLPLPGFRLGLANVVILLAFCFLSPVDAAVISAVRILLSGLLFGSATSLYFSAMGGIFSFVLLLVLRRIGKRCSYAGVSILSAAAHNAGQLAAAATLFGGGLFRTYLPALLIASVVYGGAVGLLLNLLAPRMAKLFRHVTRGRGENV